LFHLRALLGDGLTLLFTALRVSAVYLVLLGLLYASGRRTLGQGNRPGFFWSQLMNRRNITGLFVLLALLVALLAANASRLPTKGGAL
ncbi:MAG: hypothetical protein M3498_15515, partial [Deinococcota bacterium]|nr:hypothetical protein [Deinococcota bacterium]